MNQTLVSTKYQVVIPKAVRKQVGIQPGQRLNVHTTANQIILSPTKETSAWKWPEDYIKNLPNLWKGEDSEKWLEEERNSWER